MTAGIDKHIFDRALRFGNMVTSMSFLANSLSWAFMSSSGFFERKQRKVFHSVCTSDVISGGFINSSPCTVLHSDLSAHQLNPHHTMQDVRKIHQAFSVD